MTAPALVIPPRDRDLGDGMKVRRALPHPRRRAVGPFVFWDHFGPLPLGPTDGMLVRAHPHIGLSTLTWMFSGRILHRDSLGTEATVEAGAVNWMTAGRGISHSERAGVHAGLPAVSGEVLEGIQLWVALPAHAEDDAPSFFHLDAEGVPEVEAGGARWKVVAGTVAGVRSPVPVRSPLFLADTHLAAGAVVTPPVPEGHEAALYVARGAIEVAGEVYGEGHLLVLGDGPAPTVRAHGGAHVQLFGGEPLPEPRHLWWNFVATTPERLDAARADWAAAADRFGRVPHETDRIPLPDGP